MSERTVDELKKIKKLYGEDFMHLCRELFPTILEHEGLLLQILTTTFATNSRTLYRDIIKSNGQEDLKKIIYSRCNFKEREPALNVDNKTPYELLDEAGYILYECKTESDIQKFRKYYAPGEQLCTFDGGRLNKCVVFWAVKKDVAQIKRKDFKEPRREDKYGTSVLSLQFTRGSQSTLSIKNRYNHRVINPDATFGNDLDKIIPGLTASFTKLLDERGMQLNTANREGTGLLGYVLAGDGKYYKFNWEINGTYYCPGNVVISGWKPDRLEPEKMELIDFFVIDKENKILTTYDSNTEDSFTDYFNQEIERIEEKKDKDKKTKTFFIKLKDSKEVVEIEVNSDGNIIRYKNNELTKVARNFMKYSVLRELEVKNLKEAGDGFLRNNHDLHTLIAPNLEKIGYDCLTYNTSIKELDLPNLLEIGTGFLRLNYSLKKFNAPKLKKIGSFVLCHNNTLEELNAPDLEEGGTYSLQANSVLKNPYFPKMQESGAHFLEYNTEFQNFLKRRQY